MTVHGTAILPIVARIKVPLLSLVIHFSINLGYTTTLFTKRVSCWGTVHKFRNSMSLSKYPFRCRFNSELIIHSQKPSDSYPTLPYHLLSSRKIRFPPGIPFSVTPNRTLDVFWETTTSRHVTRPLIPISLALLLTTLYFYLSIRPRSRTSLNTQNTSVNTT